MPPRKKSPDQTPPAASSTGKGASGKATPGAASGSAAAHGRVYLIDTMSFIFRAYHAMVRQRPMSTKTGLPTAAIYVFVNMLRKLRDDFSPEYLAAVFDVAGPTFRDEQADAVTSIKKFDIKTQTFTEVEYKGYKANRVAMPEDLAQQVPYIRRALEAYRIPILEVIRFEADDVIGTLARKASEASHPVYVVSSDKDMMQLVNDKVQILNPPKDNLICDAAKVEEILGVPPERVIDVMALRGDAIDNIPGAPGIGDKGSVEIIKRFGTVELALEHAAEVERKTYRESLLNNRDTILFSKSMATIDTNVPIELNVESMRAGEPDVDALRALFTELEFTSLLKELLPVAEVSETHYTEATSAADIESVLGAVIAGGALAVALEQVEAVTAREPDEEEDKKEEDKEEELQTAQLSFMEGTMGGGSDGSMGTLGDLMFTSVPAPTSRRVALSAAVGSAVIVKLDSDNTGEKLRSVLRDAAAPKSVHDYKAAIHALDPLGISLAGVRHDPMLYSYLLDPTYSSHRLADVALRRFNLKVAQELAESADITGRLAGALRSEVEQAGLDKLYEEIDLPLVPVLARMEQAGVKIDTAALLQMSSELERESGAKAKEIYEVAGMEFNVGSPKQLGDVLFNRMNLPKPVKYGKGRTISTAVDVLEQLAENHPIARMVLDYRQLTKLKSTYVDALPVLIHPVSRRLHTTFGQTGTATGRLSSANPNLQNIPIRTELGRGIRAAFIAEPGHVLLTADYSQIELRLLAHFSHDSLLVEAYRRGDDVHTLTASQVFGVPPLMVTPDHRRQAKVVNFGIVYGLSPFGLSQNLGIEPGEAKQFIAAYFEKYSGVRAFIDRTLEEARRVLKVKTLFGRVRPIPDINSKNANQRGFAERTAVNTPLQGTAADLIKIAMIRIDAALSERGLKSRMTLQVHDELVFEVPENEVGIMQPLVREHMEKAHALAVPLQVEMGVGPNWRDLE
ncbi:MAG TPA: DNA polymerase I [Candidatus Acidoferrum sp.]|nr:DNA polymerase I [Candidatus Acidoferrum sp.]